MVWFGDKQKALEMGIIAFFSALILALFYFFLGANGLVLGNDPAVHLEYAKYFLSTGHLPLSSIIWLPPLYNLVLSTFITFTGAVTVDQQLFIMKAVTAVVDWMLVFSAYMLAARFFNKRTGFIAASFLLLCFPLWELNSWGGYTSVLSISFMALLFVYLALPMKSAANALMAFILAFSVVLTHQLAAFISLFILAPFIVVVLIKSRGNVSKVLVAAVVGGGIAFGIYYLQPMLPFIGEIVDIVFYQIKTMAYQIPAVSLSSFITNFGFIIFFTFAGLAVAFYKLKKQKTLIFYLLLVLAFGVSLFFSQSYMVGFYLPFQWFNYYILPALVVLAAVAFIFMLEWTYSQYLNNKAGWKRYFLKISSIAIIVVLAAAMALHFGTVSGKLVEATTYYSTSDISAYQMGDWIRQNYGEKTADVVVSREPGHWFWVYSGLNVIAETDPVIDWNVNASNVLDFAEEMVNPLTMYRFYQAKTGISDESYVQSNMVWKRIAYTASDNSWFSYRDLGGVLHNYTLPSLNRTIIMDERQYPMEIAINYTGPDFVLTKHVFAYNDSYPLTVTWELTPLNNNVNYVIFYLTQNFVEGVPFNKANLGGALNWQNPLDNPSKMEQEGWGLTNFNKQNLTISNCIDVYNEKDQIAYAIKFLDLPNSGNIGALWNRNIDAIRWQYDMFKVDLNYTITLRYQVLAFSMSSYPQLKDAKTMDTLFDLKTDKPFEVQSRDFASIIYNNCISFIVYDKTRFDAKILSTGWVQLVYSNDRYIVLKIKVDHPYLIVYKGVDKG